MGITKFYKIEKLFIFKNQKRSVNFLNNKNDFESTVSEKIEMKQNMALEAQNYT